MIPALNLRKHNRTITHVTKINSNIECSSPTNISHNPDMQDDEISTLSMVSITVFNICNIHGGSSILHTIASIFTNISLPEWLILAGDMITNPVWWNLQIKLPITLIKLFRLLKLISFARSWNWTPLYMITQLAMESLFWTINVYCVLSITHISIWL